MAFDGFTVACLRKEFSEALTGGYLAKIIQPESDALLLTVKNNGRQYRLLLSASAALPLAYLTEKNRIAPLTAPNFCMLLRKYIGGGKILAVEQPGLERILVFRLEHRDELGDMKQYRLILELMGKYSNLILTDDTDMILDSARHVSFRTSSVREVLPGRHYFIPETQHKCDPLSVSEEAFNSAVFDKPLSLAKAVAGSFTGFSYVMAEEVCVRASLDGGLAAEALDAPAKTHLYHTFARLLEDVREGDFKPVVYYDKNNSPVEFSAFRMLQFKDMREVSCSSMSGLLQSYYEERDRVNRIRQKSTDLRKVVNTVLERNVRTLNLQEKQRKDTEKRDKYRIFGELLNTYGYTLQEGADVLEAEDYNTGKMVRIPLDTTKNARENAQHYFDRYGKLKRTAEALDSRIKETQETILHLESILTSLDLARTESDLGQIRQELEDSGYIRRHTQGKKRGNKPVSSPLHYISSDGFDMYVGKNNYQNEEVSFHIASGGDWWFHANDMPGSHVIVKAMGKELPDRTFEEAGRLAAYYSKGKNAPKVEIDYTLRKNLKKPTGGKPGFVVYYTNYSMMSRPDISGIREADQ